MMVDIASLRSDLMCTIFHSIFHTADAPFRRLLFLLDVHHDLKTQIPDCGNDATTESFT